MFPRKNERIYSLHVYNVEYESIIHTSGNSFRKKTGMLKLFYQKCKRTIEL